MTSSVLMYFPTITSFPFLASTHLSLLATERRTCSTSHPLTSLLNLRCLACTTTLILPVPRKQPINCLKLFSNFFPSPSRELERAEKRLSTRVASTYKGSSLICGRWIPL